MMWDRRRRRGWTGVHVLHVEDVVFVLRALAGVGEDGVVYIVRMALWDVVVYMGRVLMV